MICDPNFAIQKRLFAKHLPNLTCLNEPVTLSGWMRPILYADKAFTPSDVKSKTSSTEQSARLPQSNGLHQTTYEKAPWNNRWQQTGSSQHSGNWSGSKDADEAKHLKEKLKKRYIQRLEWVHLTAMHLNVSGIRNVIKDAK